MELHCPTPLSSTFTYCHRLLLSLSHPLTPPPATVFAGRYLMSLWTGSAKIHELYTAACGLYVCWLSIRAITVLLAWMPQGRRVILLKVQEWTLMVMLCNTVMTINTHHQHTPELFFF